MFLLEELEELEYLLSIQNDLLATHISRYGSNVTDADIKRSLIINSALTKIQKKISRIKKKQQEI